MASRIKAKLLIFNLIISLIVGLCILSYSSIAWAVELKISVGNTGKDVEQFKKMIALWTKKTGNTVKVVTMPSSTTDQFAQYRLWLAAGNSDIDLYQTDVIWAPQLAGQFVDLKDAAKDVIKDHFPSIIKSQTVNGKLVALPLFTDAPALFYRKDLLKKYDQKVPKTWEELTKIAAFIQKEERKSGNSNIWGYVWQGKAYEGLTCNALEWISSYGGGKIIEENGNVSINNPQAIKALKLAKSWVGNISPNGVLSYSEEESRGIWQSGNSVFMRNWPYAYILGNESLSPIAGLFDVAPLPKGSKNGSSASTLGGWNITVSKYSKHKKEAIDFALFITSRKIQKIQTLATSHLPTIIDLYDDKEIATKQPIIPKWKEVFLKAVPRPSAATGIKYNEISNNFYTAVHSVLSGEITPEDSLAILSLDLKEIIEY